MNLLNEHIRWEWYELSLLRENIFVWNTNELLIFCHSLESGQHEYEYSLVKKYLMDIRSPLGSCVSFSWQVIIINFMIELMTSCWSRLSCLVWCCEHGCYVLTTDTIFLMSIVSAARMYTVIRQCNVFFRLFWCMNKPMRELNDIPSHTICDHLIKCFWFS